METKEFAKLFCKNEPEDNPPKRGEKYYFGRSSFLSFATEISHDILKPNTFCAIPFFSSYLRVLVDGVYENSDGTFVGVFLPNGAYTTVCIIEVHSLNNEYVQKKLINP